MNVVKCIWLPHREEARIIFQKYITDVSYFHHVIHEPSFQSLIDDIYDAIEQKSGIHLGAILLLLSVCASAVYSWTPLDDARCMYASSTEANSQTTFWMKQALDVTNYANRISHMSLECVQGLMILFFTFCHLEGFSQRARSIISSTVLMATELSLHRIDCPNSSGVHESIRISTVRTEVGRRVWWYIVATDW